MQLHKGLCKMSRNIKRWIIGLIIIIVILSIFIYYYQNLSFPFPNDKYSLINEEGAEKITNSFLNNSSLIQYHINNVTIKYGKKVIDFQVNLYNQSNKPVGWVFISGGTARVAAININGIEIQNYASYETGTRDNKSYVMGTYSNNHLKITPSLWQKISELNSSSYCHCILNLEPSFSKEDKSLLIKDQEFEFENSTALTGVFPINKINDIINNEKIKSIDYVK